MSENIDGIRICKHPARRDDARTKPETHTMHRREERGDNVAATIPTAESPDLHIT
jgi:hypothetical protein